MLYVILVASAIIFWLVAVDRSVLRVTFTEGKITKEKGIFRRALNTMLLKLRNVRHSVGSLKFISNVQALS